MPHITWCLTRLLTFAPIHAAGLYVEKEQPKIFDYVVSSYTPTLTALLRANRRRAGGSHSPRILAVSQPATLGLEPLPGTVRELDAIQRLQSQTGGLHFTRLDDREVTVTAVLQSMKDYNWVHFACHADQNAASPTDDAFLFFDGRLTLKEILKQSPPSAEFAVLSACGRPIANNDLLDESIHLAAGMMLAGYSSVVASMWSIMDEDAPIVMEKLYKYLFDEADGDIARAAYALHDAVAHLRDVRGEKNFVNWAPFIHLGICLPSASPH
jgi:CHAT domain-containing protein